MPIVLAVLIANFLTAILIFLLRKLDTPNPRLAHVAGLVAIGLIVILIAYGSSQS